MDAEQAVGFRDSPSREAHPAEGSQEFSFCFATINRPHCVQRLVRSIRQRFGEVPILVGDQSGDDRAFDEFYRRLGVEVVYLDRDAGVCRARNAVVSRVRSPYFVLCDDDFIITPDTTLEPGLHILRSHPEIMVVGGRLMDIFDFNGTEQGHDRHWENFFFIDKTAGLFLSLPMTQFRPVMDHSGPYRFYYCDAVMNFAVMRTALFHEHGHRWDERFKSNGEHEDFYLTLKMRGDFRVAYTPEMVCQHHHPPDVSYSLLRDRTLGWRLFGEKWGVRQYYDLPFGLKMFEQGCEQVAPFGSPAAFFRAPDLRGEYAEGGLPGQLGVMRDGAIYNAYSHTPSGAGGAVIAVNRRGEMATVNRRACTPEGPAGRPGILTPTDLGLMRDATRQALSLTVHTRNAFFAGQRASVLVEIRNASGQRIRMGERRPFRPFLSYHLARGDSYVVWEGERTPPICDLFDTSVHLAVVRCPEEPGSYVLEVDLMIDGMGWVGVPARLPIEVLGT